MSDAIVFDPVDRIAAGALGEPGRRTFLIQAARGDDSVTVLVEKEQVAMLVARLFQLLRQVSEDYPEDPLEVERALSAPAGIQEPADPLFRARMMRLGFDPGRDLVVLELFEDVPGELDDADDDAERLASWDPDEHGDELGWRARLYATRAQVRAMAARGAEAVAAGRPMCPLCMLPEDPGGHDCPARN